MDKFCTFIGWVIVGVGTAIVMACLRGLLLAQLWAWFISEPFAVRTLSIPLAIGLGLVANTFIIKQDRHKKKKKKEGDEKEEGDKKEESDSPGYGQIVVMSVCEMLGILLLGYIIHLFM